ncbi:MAG TPA: glycosyltransferase family 4 protein [Tepidisphaeraceae bacterium]|nr:glycosyltransferase family 4 protein [Tepidisphaeraceae bacterium]
MHVLILNQTFYPDVAATAQHMWDLARHLDRHGHRVTALASRTLYGTDRPAGPAHERIGAIEIHRVRGTGLGKRSLAARATDFASFYAAAGAKLQQLPAPDVILALSSPPMIAALGMMQKQFRVGEGGRRPRFVYHVMDLYPDAAVASGLFRCGGVTHRALGGITGQTLRAADAVIALGRDMRQRILARYRRHVSHERIHVVPPWADGRELFPLARADNPLAAQLGLRDTFNVVYSGNLGVAHDVTTIIQAIEMSPADAQLRWVFIGGGNGFDRIREQSARANWPHVHILPYKDRHVLNQSLNLADVHLVSQGPAFVGLVVPSKLFGIMAVGKPTIMIGPGEAECARILVEHDAGIVIPNGDAGQLTAAIQRLSADPDAARAMGRRARHAFDRHYDREIACERIMSMLEQICGGSRSVLRLSG